MTVPVPKLTQALRDEYEALFDTCAPSVPGPVRAAWSKIVLNRDTYTAAGAKAGGVPWHVVGVLHSLEASGRFDRHLHNGDPLSARTVHVPAGRPTTGTPPFAWQDSAADALVFDGFAKWKDWTIGGTLYQLEAWNGWGYRRFHPGVLSPYLWAGCQHYTSGKYVADGSFSPTAVSKQIGAAVLLRVGTSLGDVTFKAAGD